MSGAYIGEIRILPYARGAPSNWQVCDGTLLSVADNEPLFMLLGTTYGGDGQTTFAVPDLRSRIPVHQGTGGGMSPRTLGEVSGTETVTLVTAQMGAHSHMLAASIAPGTSASPTNAVLAAIAGVPDEVLYAVTPASADSTAFPASMIAIAGGNQAHDNTAPTLTLQYCISLFGLFPNKP